MEKTNNKLSALTRFCTVGVVNTIIDLSTFFILVGVGIPYFFAQILAYSAGMGNSYIWNRFWTFQWRQKVRVQEIIRFVSFNLSAAVITYILLSIFQEEFGFSLFLSKGIATVGGVVITFSGSKYWVFKEVISNKSYQES